MAIMTLDEWAAQYPTIRGKSRALWKMIRWEFEEQEPPMTVRQMFYRMSSEGHVPKTEAGYRQVQYALTAMRRANAVPYEWIADNTRWRRKPTTYDDIGAALTFWQQNYRRSLWATQPVYVEIWLEKDALAGVIYDVTDEYDVPLYVTRGYPSLSYLHNAAEALRAIRKPIVIYHFGDFDASGKDAARAIREGLADFGARFTFREVAVLERQIDELSLQTRPAKSSDPRAARWGREAVELDAIPPALLRQMVREVIEANIDKRELARVREIEEQERESIGGLVHALGEIGTSTSTKIARNRVKLHTPRAYWLGVVPHAPFDILLSDEDPGDLSKRSIAVRVYKPVLTSRGKRRLRQVAVKRMRLE